MITNMAFGVRQVRDFLKENGHVLTVRGYDYGHESATVIGIGRIHRKNMGEVKTIDDIKPFVTLSGFTDVRDWWQQIKKFCRGRMWLYRVQIDTNTTTKKGRDKERKDLIRMCPEVMAAIDGEGKNNFEDYWDRSTVIEEYNVFAGEMAHPADRVDNLREFHDSYMIDLQPHKDAVHADRMQREARQAERRRERMRERAGEQQGQIITMIKQDILMVTGNRKLRDPDRIQQQLCDIIDSRKPDIAISGMAIGADQLFAEICIEKGIPVYAYIPFSGQENRWSAREQKRYRELLSHCEKKIIVCDHPSKKAFFDRNAAMVKVSSRAVVVWDGQLGGTAHTKRLLDRDSVPHEIIDNVSGA